MSRSTSVHVLRDKQVNEARPELMVNLPGTELLEMSWLRKCTDEDKSRDGLMVLAVS